MHALWEVYCLFQNLTLTYFSHSTNDSVAIQEPLSGLNEARNLKQWNTDGNWFITNN